MKTLTVFTPTYNRASLLSRLYQSLQKQSNKDFLWMIIDDGSTDETQSVVSQWIKEETTFPIEYYKKENGGLHTGYNLAIEKATTELMMCVDSDDFVAENAIDEIIRTWRRKGNNDFAGIIGLDADVNGNPISGLLPEAEEFNLIDYAFGKYNLKRGDTKLVVRTDLYKSVAPIQTFPGEKNFNPQLLHLKISLNYDFIPINKILCIVDYQPDGMTGSILNQFYNSPNSFCEYRKFQLSIPNSPLVFRLRYSIHYVSSCFLAKRKHIVRDSPSKLSTCICYLPGWVLSKYIIIRVMKNDNYF